MASSTGVKLFNSFQMWLVLNFLGFGVLGTAVYGFARVSYMEAERGVRSLAETLVRARLSDLRSQNYRAFIEGLGPDFKDVRIEVESSSGRFESRPKALFEVCHQVRIEEGRPLGLMVSGCRPLNLPLFTFVALVLIGMTASIISFRYILAVEISAVRRLVDFFAKQGVEVDSNQGLRGLVARVEELLEKVRAAQEVSLGVARLEARSKIAEQVSHDIRSPLAAIKAVLYNAGDIPPDTVELLKSAANRVQEISSGLREHLQEEKKPRQLVHVPTLISAAYQEKLCELHQRKELKVRLEIDCPIGFGFCIGDSCELQRVVSNLMNNAAEAICESGSIGISVLGNESSVRVCVSDTGIGIPRSVLGKLGERGLTCGKVGGAGLGLSHARAYAESCGGSLSVTSELNNGSVVSIVLPTMHIKTRPTSEILFDAQQVVLFSSNNRQEKLGSFLAMLRDRSISYEVCSAESVIPSDRFCTEKKVRVLSLTPDRILELEAVRGTEWVKDFVVADSSLLEFAPVLDLLANGGCLLEWPDEDRLQEHRQQKVVRAQNSFPKGELMLK